ncbi:TadE/TadG family type IV pilus assembly protein [Aestuariivirga sp.]|uniref:TadE/TadG family type IV pilus assembly protein n=1 Tax=Aestuariivirga sp. TaxID=2650926 RepID=UPI0039E562B4
MTFSPLPCRISKFRANESGGAAVEFALSAPVFVLLLLGMLGYGIYLGTAHQVQELATNSARTALAGLNTAERNSLVASFVASNIGSYSFIDNSKLRYMVSNSADQNEVIVTVNYNAAELPIWSLLPASLLPSKQIIRTSSVRIGGL